MKVSNVNFMWGRVSSPFFIIKTYIFIFLFLIPSPGITQQWNEIWSDEFNNTSFDFNKWTHEIGTGNNGWGNNELQYYTNNLDNIFLDSGYLHIVARNQQISNSNYTSARIKTQGKFDFQYGKIEARIKVPTGQGLWPAFWMLGSNIVTESWPQCGEIDVMEHINHELKIHGTIHYDMWGHTYDGFYAFTDASLFHIYSIEWDQNKIVWFLDGVEYFSTDIGIGSVSREEFHNPFFILLNLAVGGNWPGAPDNSTTFPATMMIDYVRVYQKNSNIHNNNIESLINVFPNPASELLFVDLNSQLTKYYILNSQGVLLLEGSESEIDISKLNQGIYYIDISTDQNQSFKTTFIKN